MRRKAFDEAKVAAAISLAGPAACMWGDDETQAARRALGLVEDVLHLVDADPAVISLIAKIREAWV
jgi:hypothetical protein